MTTTRRFPLFPAATLLAVFAIVSAATDSPVLSVRFSLPDSGMALRVAAPDHASPGTALRAPATRGAFAPATVPERWRPAGEFVAFDDMIWGEWAGSEEHGALVWNGLVVLIPAGDPGGSPRRRFHDGSEDHGWGARVASLSDSLVASRPPPGADRPKARLIDPVA